MSDGSQYVAEMQEPEERLEISREEHLAHRIHRTAWALARMNFSETDLAHIANLTGAIEKTVERRKNQLTTEGVR